MLVSWQTLPLSLHPVAGFLGGLPVTWYAIMYALGMVFSGLYFVWIAKKSGLSTDSAASIEMIVSILWGVIIGARLGYVIFYGGSAFLEEPWRIASPYDFTTGEWTGIRGMSFHGGLIGGALGLFMFTREAGRHFFRFSDVLVQAVPIALFFGRMGNFLNQEILGRATNWVLGMHFPAAASLLLHPVTLYEAALEGVLLFLVLAWLGRRTAPAGQLTALFLIFYALVRYFAEGYRALPLPENLVAGIFSMGQVLSLIMAFFGLGLFLAARRRMIE